MVEPNYIVKANESLAADNDRLRALVEELVRGLNDCINGFDMVYEAECTSYGTSKAYENAKRLVAKAREVVR